MLIPIYIMVIIVFLDPEPQNSIICVLAHLTTLLASSSSVPYGAHI